MNQDCKQIDPQNSTFSADYATTLNGVGTRLRSKKNFINGLLCTDVTPDDYPTLITKGGGGAGFCTDPKTIWSNGNGPALVCGTDIKGNRFCVDGGFSDTADEDAMKKCKAFLKQP